MNELQPSRRSELCLQATATLSAAALRRFGHSIGIIESKRERFSRPYASPTRIPAQLINLAKDWKRPKA
jgi:hypothetical protein